MAKRVKRWFDTPLELDLLDVVVFVALICFIVFSIKYTTNNVNKCVNSGHTLEYCERGLE